MQKTSDYYVVKQKAVPEVLLKVVEAKRLLESGKAATIQDAVERVDISRSSLKVIADFGANILTIHQSIPINGVASLSISVQVLSTTGDVSRMLETMEERRGVRNVKILAKE